VTLEEFKKEITVSFSGYNILKNIKWAINSFLYFHPDMKDNIVVFDDNSTDETKEWLTKVGIKRITWTDRFKKYIENYGRGQASDCLSYYVSVMINDIMHQTKTKYLMLNDGDVVFLNRVIDKYYKQIEGQKALLIVIRFIEDLFSSKSKEVIGDRLNDYEILRLDGKFFYRMHQFHAFLDIDYFKEIELIFDNIDDKFLKRTMFEPYVPVDTGFPFLYEVIKRKIPVDGIMHQENCNDPDFFHFGWAASMQRLNKGFEKERFLTKNYKERTRVFLEENFERIKGLKEVMNDPKIIDHLG